MAAFANGLSIQQSVLGMGTVAVTGRERFPSPRPFRGGYRPLVDIGPDLWDCLTVPEGYMVAGSIANFSVNCEPGVGVMTIERTEHSLRLLTSQPLLLKICEDPADQRRIEVLTLFQLFLKNPIFRLGGPAAASLIMWARDGDARWNGHVKSFVKQSMRGLEPYEKIKGRVRNLGDNWWPDGYGGFSTPTEDNLRLLGYFWKEAAMMATPFTPALKEGKEFSPVSGVIVHGNEVRVTGPPPRSEAAIREDVRRLTGSWTGEVLMSRLISPQASAALCLALQSQGRPPPPDHYRAVRIPERGKPREAFAFDPAGTKFSETAWCFVPHRRRMVPMLLVFFAPMNFEVTDQMMERLGDIQRGGALSRMLPGVPGGFQLGQTQYAIGFRPDKEPWTGRVTLVHRFHTSSFGNSFDVRATQLREFLNELELPWSPCATATEVGWLTPERELRALTHHFLASRGRKGFRVELLRAEESPAVCELAGALGRPVQELSQMIESHPHGTRDRDLFELSRSYFSGELTLNDKGLFGTRPLRRAEDLATQMVWAGQRDWNFLPTVQKWFAKRKALHLGQQSVERVISHPMAAFGLGLNRVWVESRGITIRLQRQALLGKAVNLQPGEVFAGS